MPFASGHFKTGYGDDLCLVETRARLAALIVFLAALLVLPFLASPFILDLATQVLLTLIGAVALMLLTGYAGQISLGHAGFLAAGAFTTGILFKELHAPFWVTFPASALVGGVLGLIFGFPSLRLKGLYLALSTMALHFIVTYVGGEYQTRRGFATGIVLDAPKIGSFVVNSPVVWYFILLVIDILVVLFALNLIRSRTGRAWIAIRDRDVAAAALGIKVSRYKLLAFVVSSMMTCLAGSLFSYYRGFVSVDAFSLLTTIEYVAIIIVGGLASILGTIYGTIFIVLLPYVIDMIANSLAFPARFTTYLSAIKYGMFGLIMIVFLLLEPGGLVAIWNRVRDYFLLWPFRYKALGK
jgi:branched-chain amino acid transport system permease protein